MARVPEIRNRELVEPAKRHMFDEILESRKRISPPYAVMFNAPDTVLHSARLAEYLLNNVVIPRGLSELSIAVTAKYWSSDVPWSHSQSAMDAGIPKSVIDVVAAKGPTTGMDPDCKLIIDFTRELLTTQRSSKPLFDAVQQKWGNRGVIELLTTIGFYSMICLTLNSCEVVRPPDDPGLPRRTQ